MKLIAVVLLVSVAWSAHAGDNSPFRYYGHDYDRTPLGDSIDKATLKLLKEAYDHGESKNVISSPLGVMLLLSMYGAGASEGSQKEISQLLGGEEYKKVSESYGSLNRQYDEMDDDYLTLGNKVFVGNQYKLNEAFANNARSAYHSEVDKIDFGDSQKAADIINGWSDEKTKGHIKKPVSPDDLDADTVAALVNVIFFQGHWHVPFDANNTKEEDFHVDKNTIVKKPTMKLHQSLFYAESEELGAKMVELPYKEPGFRMVIVLPDEIDGLQSVLEKAAQKGLLEDVFKLAPAGSEVDFSMPKFEIKSKLNLNNLLPKVGISKIFEEPASEVVEGGVVKVSKAFQEAFVKVDEEGATAGAFTGILGITYSTSSMPKLSIDFNVDHPFLFIVYHEDKALFAGTYSMIAVPMSSNYVPPPPQKFNADHPFLFYILHMDKVLFAGTYAK